MTTPNDDNKDTAVSHSARTPPLSAALEAFTDAPQVEGNGIAADGEELDLSLLKKKKAKKVEADNEDDDDAADEKGDDGDEPALDLGLKKKKKKKVKVAEGEEDSFAAKLQALDLEKEGAEERTETGDLGDMDEGTGIWQHDDQRAFPYEQLLTRFFALLSQKNPDHASGGTRSYKIPPPQCMREGNKKTIFVNLPEICKRMNRSDEHVTAFIFTELGTSGSVDGSRRLVIKGRFQAKQLENVLRKYIIDYVTCRTCRSPETTLSKGENRLYFITCNSCGSRRSVQAIKTGFSAQVGKRKKMQG